MCTCQVLILHRQEPKNTRKNACSKKPSTFRGSIFAKTRVMPLQALQAQLDFCGARGKPPRATRNQPESVRKVCLFFSTHAGTETNGIWALYATEILCRRDSVPQRLFGTETLCHKDSVPQRLCGTKTLCHKDSVPQRLCAIKTPCLRDSVPQRLCATECLDVPGCVPGLGRFYVYL